MQYHTVCYIPHIWVQVLAVVNTVQVQILFWAERQTFYYNEIVRGLPFFLPKFSLQFLTPFLAVDTVVDTVRIEVEGI